MQSGQFRKYGVEFTVDFELYEVDGVDLRVDWTPAAADCEVQKDGGNFVQCTNTAIAEDGTYSITITATEAEAARIVIKVVDAATKVFLDKIILVETYGNASAQHAFDLDTASVAQGADNNTILSSLTIANGAVDAKLTYVMDTILTEGGAGRLAAALIKFLDVATPTGTINSIPDAVAGAAGGIAIVGSEMVVPNTQKVDVETIKTQAVTCGAGVTINPSVGAATIVPTNTQFEARTIVSADYVVVGDTIAAVTTIPAVTLANGAHGGAAATITLATPIAATVPDTQKVDVNTIKTQVVTCAAGVTVNPSVGAATIVPTVEQFNARTLVSAGYASPTNITAGVITTVTNLTNAATAGDFNATQKTSLNNATPAVTVSDKTGYSLAATGLDAITATAPGGVATTFPQMVVQLWRRFFKKADMTSSQLVTYADNGTTPETTQTLSDVAGTETQGAAT